MANKRSLHYHVGGSEAVEQPVLFTVPGPSPARTGAVGEQATERGRPLRGEWAKQVGLAGVAKARAALAGAARRAEAERTAGRAAGRAA